MDAIVKEFGCHLNGQRATIVLSRYGEFRYISWTDHKASVLTFQDESTAFDKLGKLNAALMFKVQNWYIQQLTEIETDFLQYTYEVEREQEGY